MPITDFPQVWLPNVFSMTAGSAPALATMGSNNAAGDKSAFVIQVPKSGTLDYFEWVMGTVNNNPDNGIRLSFQDIDPATGFPDGVQDQFADMTGTFISGAWQVPTVMTDTGLSGGVKRVVTRGQYLGCVLDFINFVALDNWGPNCQSASATTYMATHHSAYCLNGSTGTYVKTNNTPAIALKYNDGSYGIIPFVYPMLAGNTHAYNNGSTPDERALRFKVPYSCRITGFWVRLLSGAVMDVILYDSANNVLASASLDPDIRGGTATETISMLFNTEVTLDPAETYRLSFLPTSASSISIYSIDVPNNALLATIPGGIEWYSSTRVNAGSWTDVTTNRLLAGLILNGFDLSGAGGGGGEHSSVF